MIKNINLYLKDNGIIVTGSTDKYYRLSSNGIKEWYASVPQPTEQDITFYQNQIDIEEAAKKQEEDIKRIKEYTHQDILNDYEDWKQRNMIASALDTLVSLLVTNNVITQESVDTSSLSGLKGILDTINTRRTLSDQQEQDLINGVKTLQEIHDELYPKE